MDDGTVRLQNTECRCSKTETVKWITIGGRNIKYTKLIPKKRAEISKVSYRTWDITYIKCRFQEAISMFYVLSNVTMYSNVNLASCGVRQQQSILTFLEAQTQPREQRPNRRTHRRCHETPGPNVSIVRKQSSTSYYYYISIRWTLNSKKE